MARDDEDDDDTPGARDPEDDDPESSLNLLRRAQAGDEDALNALLERYIPRLERWASPRLPASLKTMLATGDIVQEAVINAIRHFRTLEIRSDGAFQAYLRQAVNNRIIDLLRRKSRRPSRVELSDGVVADDTSPLDAAIGSEAAERYERGLAQLDDEERHLIVLRVEFGMDFAEIARQLGKPSADAARMAFKRALARLSSLLGRR